VGGQRLAVGAERDGVCLAAPGESVELLARRKAPDPNRPVLAGRGEELAVGLAATAHTCPVPLPLDRLAGGGVVDPTPVRVPAVGDYRE
jgi:hypothetical protein